ncbi:MAG: dicarboxylate/amino acid:cation symporter [Planctomycetota bacterium]|nr:dicarboxylate/amino acid:cation symporter [Planctomycetota bacterium]
MVSCEGNSLTVAKRGPWRDRWVSWGSVVALFAGVAVGQWLHSNGGSAEGWAAAGDLILIRPLMLVVMPLVLVSVITGVTSIGSPSRLGLLGGAAIVYYTATMIVACTLGAFLVTWVDPGGGVSPEVAKDLLAEGSSALSSNPSLAPRIQSGEAEGLSGAWLNIIRQVVPGNPFAEMANGRPLGIIGFALLIGAALAVACDRIPAARMARDAINGVYEALLVAVQWIIVLLPIGAFCLVVSTVARTGLTEFSGPIAKYMGVVVLGLLTHALIVLPIVARVGGVGRPWQFMYRCRAALGTAFVTSSSSATLPVTLEAGVEAGASRRATNFVCPLGSTVNMDGTALYEAVAVVFLFQFMGIELGMQELVVVVVTATLAAIGAASIPSAGLVTMVLVIGAVNTSLADPSKALPLGAIGLILGVDRILDMLRTSVNVWGDLVGARMLTPLAPDDDASSQSVPAAHAGTDAAAA